MLTMPSSYATDGLSPSLLLFLDVDGVLAPFESEAPFESTGIARLNEIVERTGASVVITSTWRERLSLDALREEFRRAGFRGDVAGLTSAAT